MGFKEFLKEHIKRDNSTVDSLDDERVDDENEEQGVFGDEEEEQAEAKVTPPEYKSFERKKAEFERKASADNTSAKSFGKIHSMNETSFKRAEATKCKIASIKLTSITDASNAADKFKDNNTMVIVNFEKLNDAQFKRASDFLDGAKYAAGLVMKKHTEKIYLYFPASIEISGDFYEQVEINGFTLT